MMELKYPIDYDKEKDRYRPICGILAMAVLTQNTLEYTFNYFKEKYNQRNRAFNGGTYRWTHRRFLTENNIKYKMIYSENNPKKLKRGRHWAAHFLEADKTYILYSDKHIFLFKDGIMMDQCDKSYYTEHMHGRKLIEEILELIC